MTIDIDSSLPDACHDFDFLIGAWDATIQVADVDAVLHGRWTARHLHVGRLVLDDLVVFDPAGDVVRSVATLRTWVPANERWAMTFLYALEQPEPIEFHGRRVGDEFRLTATSLTNDRSVSARFFDIDDVSFRWEQSDDHGGVAIDIGCTRRV